MITPRLERGPASIIPRRVAAGSTCAGELAMEQPYLLCGLGHVGWRVFEYLRAANLPVVIIDTRCAPDDPRLEKARLVVGDCRRQEVLEQAGIASARGVLILTSDDLI